MSKRITIKTQFTDKAALQRACNDNDWAFKIQGDRADIDGGPLRGATINLKTGDVTGDTDFHSEATANAFGMAYSEALWMNRISETGYLEGREVLEDGTVRLTAYVAVA